MYVQESDTPDLLYYAKFYYKIFLKKKKNSYLIPFLHYNESLHCNYNYYSAKLTALKMKLEERLSKDKENLTLTSFKRIKFEICLFCIKKLESKVTF